MTEAEWLTQVDKLPTLRRFAVRLALMFVGTTEDAGANNDSKGYIAGMLARAGIATPAAWCAAFLSFVLGVPPCAGALRLAHRYQETRTPSPGDMFAYPTDDKGAGHCGLIVGVNDLEVATIEGNSGNRVAKQRRDRKQPSMRFYRVLGGTGSAPVPSEWPLAGGQTR
jgi:hypothetical protein